MGKKPKILLTNDDGIMSAGLKTLWEALIPYADLTIVAPVIDRSGTGLGITLRKPLHIESVAWDQNTPAWKVTGTPADCVKLALSVILEEAPDMIVSGINRGYNSGRSVLYSGTVGGVIEGGMRKIPGIAFSFEETIEPKFSSSKPHIFPIVKHILEEPLSQGTILNVNFPAEIIKGIRFARQGKSYMLDDPDQRIHPEGDPYFWLGGKMEHFDEHEESDVALLKQGFATAVPIHIDELTDHALFEKRKKSFNELFSL